MVCQCKYIEQNYKEQKCKDYFISHSNGSKIMCRLTEWKKRKRVCPYDKTIVSPKKQIKKMIEEGQKTLCYT